MYTFSVHLSTYGVSQACLQCIEKGACRHSEYSWNMLRKVKHLEHNLKASDQNGISPLYIIVEIYHSGWKPLTCSSTRKSNIIKPTVQMSIWQHITRALNHTLVISCDNNPSHSGVMDFACCYTCWDFAQAWKEKILMSSCMAAFPNHS